MLFIIREALCSSCEITVGARNFPSTYERTVEAYQTLIEKDKVREHYIHF